MLVPGADFGSTTSQITDLTDRLNRQTDHLDSLTNSVVIIANGKVTLTYDAPSKTYNDQTIPFSSGVNNGYMAYLKRSDQPTKMYAFPYTELNLATDTFLISVQVVMQGGALSTYTQISTAHPSPPATMTIYYYIIQQAIDQTAQ